MSRVEPYLGVLVALLIGFIFAEVSNSFPPTVVERADQATSTLSVVPAHPFAPITLPDLVQVATTTLEKVAILPKASTTPAKAPQQPLAQMVAPKVTLAPTPIPLVSSGNTPLDTVASSLRAALVNIICYTPAGSSFHSISGSGIFIDQKGIILTNAHVAQYFLLADKGVSCTIRSGGPATPKYRASLIYLSPSWLRANTKSITEQTPIGTGEYDFALLAVTNSVNADPLPSLFPAIPLAELPPLAGAPIVIASYGAQFLATSEVQSALYPTLVFGSVKDIFTYGTNTIDVLSLGGSVAAQEGSSGGGLADASGKLIGTITTSTVEGPTATRNLSAITASYIRAQYASEMGQALDLLLNQPTQTSINDFAPEISKLEPIITAGIP